MYKQEWEKYGVSESVYLIIWTAGYYSASRKDETNPYTRGTPRYRIWAKGRRDARKIY